MVIKYDGKEYNISQEMWEAMNNHAEERDMTIDEYIVEAFTLYREQNVSAR